MEVLVDQVVDHAADEHHVDQRRDQGQQDLEDQDIGQGKQAHGAVPADGASAFEDRLEDTEGPAEALPDQADPR